MRAILSWLRELTPLPVEPGDRQAAAELASELDSLGLVVERVEQVGQGLDQVVLARVLEISPISGADRIRRVVVDRGGGESVEVVCGAWNFEEGDVVPLAPVGAELPGGFKIGRRTMRGQVSDGMLCSARELALSDDHAGILVLARPAGELPPGVELGRSLAEHLGIGRDVVFDLDVEPNRPDCLSMLGVARDLAARYGLPLFPPEPRLEESEPSSAELASVEIEAPELCSRLIARVLTGARPVASPPLLQRRLHLAGMRPINLLVDASNYVMLELGQPNHPYDLDRLGGRGLRLRAAHAGESLVTLDGETRILGTREPRRRDESSSREAVICNLNDLPVGIAGVMGGHSSEIGEATTAVLLEVAHFDQVAVGRTARRLGLRTEASVRFERGVDPAGLERAAARFCELVVSGAEAAGVAPPKVARGIAEAAAASFEPTRFRVRPARVNALLGTSLSGAEMASLLSPVGFEVRPGGAQESLEVVVPSFRPDVTGEVDIAEEVARTFGYRKIVPTERRSPAVGALDEVQLLRRRIRRVLAGVGAHEAWTNSIVSEQEQLLSGIGADLVRLANPMVGDESVMRAGLLPGLLKALRYNSGHRNGAVRLFEIGEVFALSSAADGRARPDERQRIAVLLARRGDGAEEAVRVWQVLADSLGLARVRLVQPGFEQGAFEPAGIPGGLEPSLAGLHPARAAWLVADKTPAGPEESDRREVPAIGSLGEIDPELLEAFGLAARRIGWIELDLERLAAAPRRPELAEPVSRFPSSDIDLAFSVSDEVPAARVEETVALAAGELCESVRLFDVYRGEGLEEGQRSLAFRLRLVAFDRTLTDEEVAAVRRRCIESVEEALPAKLRA